MALISRNPIENKWNVKFFESSNLKRVGEYFRVKSTSMNYGIRGRSIPALQLLKSSTYSYYHRNIIPFLPISDWICWQTLNIQLKCHQSNTVCTDLYICVPKQSLEKLNCSTEQICIMRCRAIEIGQYNGDLLVSKIIYHTLIMANKISSSLMERLSCCCYI